MTTEAQTGDLQAYVAARDQAAWFREPRFGALSLGGADRVTFLHKLVSNDVAALEAGTAVPACLLTPKARLIAPLVVAALRGERLLVVLPEAVRERVREHLRRLVFVKRVTIEDVSERGALVFGLEGPRADAVFEALGFGPFEERSGEEAPKIAVREAEVAGARVIALRFGYGEVGWRFVVEALHPGGLEAFTEALGVAVDRAGGLEVEWRQLEPLRIECGVPAWGSELTEESFLPETGLERTHVSYTKGCYPGQEPVARVHFKGRARRTIARVLFESGLEPTPGQALYTIETEGSEPKPVGRVTSVVRRPTDGRMVALAHLRREVAAPGTALQLDPASPPAHVF